MTIQDQEKVLELKDVTKSYGSGEKQRTVLNGINFHVSQGESISIVGPSGSGKSTLLNLLGTLDTADAGEVLLLGQVISTLTANELAFIRNQKIGFIFQLHHLLPQLTVLENVLLPTLVRKENEALADRATLLLDRVGLKDLIDSFPAQLSGGEMQRVAVVRALINLPKIILADEPTGSLDKKSSESLINLLMELNAEYQTALVLVTHSESMARRMSTTYHLENGNLTPDNTP